MAGQVVNAAPPRLHSTSTVSFVVSSVEAAAIVRNLMALTGSRSLTTAALRAPSRAAFAALFHEWNAKPKSMIPKTSMKKSVATIANSTAAAPSSRPDLAATRRPNMRKLRSAFERLRRGHEPVPAL